MGRMCSLHELALNYAKKQPGMIDDVTEEAPILGVCKWKESTHDFWNVAEKITDIQGPGWVKVDSPLPEIQFSSDLERTELYTTGGKLEVPTQHALMMGGKDRYFADKQGAILRKAGGDLERLFVQDKWLPEALNCGNVYDAGGTGDGWFILSVRFDENSNVGLYNAKQFTSGTFFKIDIPYGGNEHVLHGKGHEGVFGYTILYRSILGWQMLSAAKTCAVIANIDETHAPKIEYIDNMLADVRANPKNTYLFCSPRAKIYGLNKYKRDNVQMMNADRDAHTYLESWCGIPIITSYNIDPKINHVNV